jgi:hypothetical protein
MHVQHKQPTAKGPQETFTGDVWFDVIARGEEPSRIRTNTVRFAPCADGGNTWQTKSSTRLWPQAERST